MTDKISIHAPREGSDGATVSRSSMLDYFYPRSPRGERRKGHGLGHKSGPNFYPRSPRGERRGRVPPKAGDRAISIHAPREGSDFYQTYLETSMSISIHAPREGSDSSRSTLWEMLLRFLSTLPARGATFFWAMYLAGRRFLSTLPARGATGLSRLVLRGPTGFLSTLPARGATRCGDPAPPAQTISIHAPREGSDPGPWKEPVGGSDFYPRSPRGERRIVRHAGPSWNQFLSTLPARGATRHQLFAEVEPVISIHAPREGSDWMAASASPASSPFLSTLPARGATDRLSFHLS